MPDLFSYAIAIRTLGTAGDKFLRELESICTQTVRPERVIVYIADGYDRPAFSVGKEEYVWVQKGMIAQRALRYDEMDCDCLLLLDDDVLLEPDSAERMLCALKENNADCVGADVFHNHRMTFQTKVFAAVTNLVFPHRNRKWAFIIHRNGSFSYNANPKKDFLWSQSCGGPAMLWKKEALLRQHWEDELWLDRLEFAYGDDQLESYKLYSNGGRLGVLYNAGVENQDAQSSSGSFRESEKHIYIRTKASFMIWWRTCYKNGKDTVATRLFATLAYGFKAFWLVPVMVGAAFVKKDVRVFLSYFKGLRDGWNEVHSVAFRNLPPYIQ